MIPAVLSDSGVLKEDLYERLCGLQWMFDEWTVEETDDPDDEISLEATVVELELFVFWSAFVIRKLIDSLKMSDDLESMSFKVHEHPRIESETPQDYLNWHHLGRFYDLTTTPAETTLSAKGICHQLVHSFVFMPVLAEGSRSVDALLVNSDYTRERVLYEIPWSEFDRLVTEAAEDDVNHMEYSRITGKLVKRRVAPPEPTP